MTNEKDTAVCTDDLERKLRVLLRGDPRDEDLGSVGRATGIERLLKNSRRSRETRRRTATMEDSRHRSTPSVVIARCSFAQALFPDCTQ
jgi:hypothetical protein